MLRLHLETLLEHSTFTDVSEDVCPQLVVSRDPRQRLSMLHEFLEHSKKVNCNNRVSVFPVESM